MARKLRLAVVTNLWSQGWITDEEARGALVGPLGDDSTTFDDSLLLGDPYALDRIQVDSELEALGLG